MFKRTKTKQIVMKRKLFELFKEKPVTQKVLVEKPCVKDLKEFLEARQRVRAIRNVKKRIIEQTGGTNPHVERVLQRAVENRTRRLGRLKIAVGKDKPKSRGQN